MAEWPNTECLNTKCPKREVSDAPSNPRPQPTKRIHSSAHPPPPPPQRRPAPDLADFHRQVRRVLADPPTYEAMARRARAKTLERYTAARFAADFLAPFVRAARGQPPAPTQPT